MLYEVVSHAKRFVSDMQPTERPTVMFPCIVCPSEQRKKMQTEISPEKNSKRISNRLLRSGTCALSMCAARRSDRRCNFRESEGMQFSPKSRDRAVYHVPIFPFANECKMKKGELGVEHKQTTNGNNNDKKPPERSIYTGAHRVYTYIINDTYFRTPGPTWCLSGQEALCGV